MVRTFTAVAALSMAVLLSAPAVADAGWFASDVVLGFGTAYTGSDGQPRTHRGIDLAGDPGAPVESPVSGTVAFAGAVPGQGGGTVLALSIDTDQGRVTLMPFAELETAAGRCVESGQAVGTLASDGDPSSSQPHLHLGLRNGSLYLDPAMLLVAPAPPADADGASPEAPTEVAAQAEAGTGLSGASSGGAATAAASGVSIAADAPASVQAGESPPHHAPVGGGAASVTQPAPEIGGTACGLGEGVTLSARVASATDAGPRAVKPATLGGSGSTLRLVTQRSDVAGSVASQLSRAGLPVYLGLVVAIASAVLILSIRAFERRISVDSPVSDRLGRLLQQLRTGDTLHGLTSCPGESAFTVPGPSSPREVTK